MCFDLVTNPYLYPDKHQNMMPYLKFLNYRNYHTKSEFFLKVKFLIVNEGWKGMIKTLKDLSDI